MNPLTPAPSTSRITRTGRELVLLSALATLLLI